MTRFTPIYFATFLVLIDLGHYEVVSADEGNALTTAEAGFNVEFDAAIKSLGGGFEAQVNLPILPAGKTGTVLLTLYNPTKADIPIGKIRTSCSCLQVVPKENLLKAGGELPLRIELTTPTAPKEPKTYVQFTIYSDDEHGITVYMVLELSGIVAFKDRYLSTKVERGTTEHIFRIPVLITAPVDPQKLEFDVDESLGTVACKYVVAQDGSQFIECKTSFDDTGFRRNRSGLLVMRDPVSMYMAELRCVIEPQHDIVVAPVVLQFKEENSQAKEQTSQESEQASKLVANAIVRLHDSTLVFPKTSSEGSKPVEEYAPSFEVAENKAFSVTAKRMAKGIYRVEFSWHQNVEESVSETANGVKLIVNTGKVRLQKDLEVIYWRTGSK